MRMTAITMGFYKGCMVRPGTDFEYDDSLAPLVPLPKWAVPAGSPLPPPKKPFHGKPELTLDDVQAAAAGISEGVAADTKPLDAQLAAHRKAGTRPSDPVERTGFF